MTEIYIFCVCFVQPGFGARLHQSRIYLPVGRISRAWRRIRQDKAGNSKITHSGDSQPPAMREKSTMFLWNK
ncbi:hypothetical protein E7V28_09495 [Escherichia coli]|nr:hypothetical protein [Escherichia coli]MDI4408164.1 hypothetical protein [Escherichia coli]